MTMMTRFNISEPNMAQYKSSPVGYRHTINHENSSQVIIISIIIIIIIIVIIIIITIIIIINIIINIYLSSNPLAFIIFAI